MTHILAIAGSKQSGKTSAGKYVIGHVMDSMEILKRIDEKPAFGMAEEDGELQIMDNNKWKVVENPDAYPFVRLYHLGDTLKNVAIDVFGLDPQLCYGSDADKDTETHIRWNDIRFVLAPRVVSQLKADNMINDNITIRQFLQYFGTNICRKIQHDCWVKACLRKIHMEAPGLAIICDCRFPDEVEGIKEAGGKVIRLTRSISEDTHESETALNKMNDEEFDCIIDNADNFSLRDKNYAVLDALYEWGILPLVKDK